MIASSRKDLKCFSPEVLNKFDIDTEDIRVTTQQNTLIWLRFIQELENYETLNPVFHTLTLFVLHIKVLYIQDNSSKCVWAGICSCASVLGMSLSSLRLPSLEINLYPQTKTIPCVLNTNSSCWIKECKLYSTKWSGNITVLSLTFQSMDGFLLHLRGICLLAKCWYPRPWQLPLPSRRIQLSQISMVRGPS